MNYQEPENIKLIEPQSGYFDTMQTTENTYICVENTCIRGQVNNQVNKTIQYNQSQASFCCQMYQYIYIYIPL